MAYRNMQECLRDLETAGHLKRIDSLEPDPYLELAALQRRAFRASAPALLFSRVKGCAFPAVANLFGTRERMRYIFRDGLRDIELLLKLRADPRDFLKKPGNWARLPGILARALPRRVRSGPATAKRARLSDLPQVVSRPLDGGAYVTLPQVYSEHPAKPGFFASNLGMYRVQISGGDYAPDKEAGLHYQIHRGIGPHHMEALKRGRDLPVNVSVGGPPALAMAAVLPLPEGIPELCAAGILAGRPLSYIMPEAGFSALPIPAEADFCICGHVECAGGRSPLKREGPFGDHLGYYSLAHDFPVLRVDAVYHRPDAVWPFTSVGRPPQEDSVFGDFIHELTSELTPAVFSGVHEVHAVDAAGVHPLLLAVGSERYMPFAAFADESKTRAEGNGRVPQELLTCAFSLLGNTQTSLAKYLLIAAKEDDERLSTRDVPGFLAHMLRRTDFSRDLHFVTRTTMDTLDYSGISLNQGSKLVWAAAGRPKRALAVEMPADFSLPEPFTGARLFAPGIVVCRGPAHAAARDSADEAMLRLAAAINTTSGTARETADAGDKPQTALLVAADDPDFVCASMDNFLWTTFTRSDPATDLYGAGAFTHCKHWGCSAPLIIDARSKAFHAPPLEEDPDVQKRLDAWAAPGGPLHGLL
ncbi:MAG: UbiD family decarboxylase [Desulfovibrio sp.]|jgi:4-hydroxy-3-polyprenylbenzoate decarboxylase|nr:UbiD family decarboxylase [Desulfovibrio sp.]